MRRHILPLLLGTPCRIIGAAVALTAAVGCADSVAGPIGTRPDAHDVSAAEFSRAVQDPGARGALFDALRASPYSEHKIEFDEWIRSPQARPMVAAIAAGRGEDVPTTKAALMGLRLDISVPSDQQRVRWTGEESPAVADAREYRAGALPVWVGGKVARTIDPRAGGTPEVLLLIQLAEPKAYRLGLYHESPGRGVQGAGERQEGGVLIRSTEGGVTDTIQLADLARGGSWAKIRSAQACPDDHPEWCESGGGAGGVSGGQDDPVWQTLGTTYLTTVATDHVCDNDLCGLGDDNEFEFTGRWSYGSVVETNTIRRTGVPASGIIGDLHLRLLDRVTTLSAPITVGLKETDALGDDEFGTVALSAQDLDQWVFWGYPTLTPYVAARFTW
jgi:hypothetical protein